MTGPLAGIRVLDLTRVVAGPWATQLLSDLGAEVIKIERPNVGDDCRGFGPPFIASRTGGATQSVYFLSTNRGKSSVTIDLTKPEGQDLVRELANKSDVLIENYKVGSFAKLGLDYARLSTENPRLIYCSITGFGQTGPRRHQSGYDIMIQAMGGLMSITGSPDGEPMKSGVAIADLLTGIYAALSISAALYEREQSGLGQYIDLALLDVQIATLANQAANFLSTGKAPVRHGNEHASLVPYQSFATNNGPIIVAVANDEQFARFASIIGLEHLADDPSFRSNAARVQNREALIPMISERIRAKSKEEWLAGLDKARIPAGPVNTIDAVFADPQIDARGLVVEFPTEDYGTIRVPGNPIQFSRTPVSYATPPPTLGEQTDAVLSRVLEKGAQSIEALRRQKVL